MYNLLARLLIQKPMKSIILAFVVIIVFLTGVQFIEMATGNDTLIKRETKVYQDNEMLGVEFGGESIIILFKADDQQSLLSVDTFEIMEALTLFAREQDEFIHSILSPYTFLERLIEQQGKVANEGITEVASHLDEIVEINNFANAQAEALRGVSNQLEQLSGVRDLFNEGLPKSEEALHRLLYEEETLRREFADMVIDNRYTTMTMTFRGGVSDYDKSEIVDGVRSAFDERKYPNLEVIISGKPVLDDDIRQSMQESIQKMLVMSAGFMIVILYLVFPVKWRLLPLPIIFIALLGTVGLMGWLNIPITMVSMAVFPILIGLGIDYAIQFQSRYTEEITEGVATDEKNIKGA